MIKCKYDGGSQKEAHESLKKLISDFTPKIEPSLGAECFLKLGLWEKTSVSPHFNDKMFDSILQSFDKSIRLNKHYQLAWHHYALTNYEATEYYEGIKKSAPIDNEKYYFHVISAIKGLIQSISLGGRDVTKTLQDILRLLQLWFKHGGKKEVEHLIRGSFEIIDINAWLAVIPQIIARIDLNNSVIKDTIFYLLNKIGFIHPQALIYP